jgi:hypothetical protein
LEPKSCIVKTANSIPKNVDANGVRVHFGRIGVLFASERDGLHLNVTERVLRQEQTDAPRRGCVPIRAPFTARLYTARPFQLWRLVDSSLGQPVALIR